MKYDFTGKVALVTGGAAGMGLAASKAYADAGAAVAVADINLEEAQKLVDEITADGGKAIAIKCDVADEAQVKAMVDQVIAEFGQLDMAFNNAGIQAPGGATDVSHTTKDMYDLVEGINLRGIWNCMKYELMHMRERGTGAIVNNSSVGGIVGLPGRAIYHATKHGVIGMTKSAALEVAQEGIRINAICPGTIETPMVKEMLDKEPELMKELAKVQVIGRLGQPEEIAAAVMWLSSDEASFVIGHSLVLDGGFTVH
ncbi:MAG: oxidoreductase [Micavibrio sp. TMED27]|nr:oxidoreductase [Micavibrio sp.]OUT91588.1 MAG: oxidoreductase [Micavibrio sp. TMED27]|tara:strand:+ start:212 stop:979 length:768 start_codon:yes stop_codon:yes gene_type:complete